MMWPISSGFSQRKNLHFEWIPNDFPIVMSQIPVQLSYHKLCSQVLVQIIVLVDDFFGPQWAEKLGTKAL